MDIGPDYGDMVIATRRADVSYRTKADGWEWYSHFTMLFLGAIGTTIGGAFVIGIAWKFIGWIAAFAVIGLGFWACKHYGTNHSVFDRWRYRTTRAQRRIIERRLSAHTIQRRLQKK